MTSYRIERDFLGEMEIPADTYYGIHTLRAVKNFPISGFRVPDEFICALAEVKQACTLANMREGLIDSKTGQAIIRASQEIVKGKFADQFIVDAFQGGAGTSTNMNMNEVIANRAIEILGGKKGDYELVNPLGHVNLSQSTNDVYPTALKVAAIRLVITLSEAIAKLQGAFQEKERVFAGIIKLGRTEMQDAVPITLGQEFGAYAEAFARDRWRLFKVEERLRQVNLGGTAIGTGLNAARDYIYAAIEELQNISGLGIARAENMVDVTQNADVFAKVSGLIKAAAVNLAKVASDLRLLSMGPHGGLAEITLPQLQEGSSIMPDKVNPVITEMATEVAYQVISFDQAITLAAFSGQLELNAFLPLVTFNLLTGLKLLINSVTVFRTHCVEGIKANPENCSRWLEDSLCLTTALSPYIGHGRASELSKKARLEGKTIRETATEEGLFTPEELDIIFTPQELTRPGVAGSKTIKKKKGKIAVEDTTLSQTPRGSRLHIAIFGRRNAGKSSLINALTNQNIAIVSDVPGTTTDPVYKSMEILPIGPVVIIDTAGIDDVGELGTLRIEKAYGVLAKTDLLFLVIDPAKGADKYEEDVIKRAKENNVPIIIVFNKIDLYPEERIEEAAQKFELPVVKVSALTKEGIDTLKLAMIKAAPKDWMATTIVGDLISPGDTVVLVVPIDLAAPKGRLILPQVQTIRDILDNDALAYVVKERELKAAISNLKNKPKLVVTDSQAFLKVAADTPKDVLMTSFSILFARQKGNLMTLVEGVKAIEKLLPGDKILVAEACTHHRVEDDIGTVKIPRWLTQHVGGNLDFSWVSGMELPPNVGDFKLVVHCGACMINRKEMLHRIMMARQAHVPIINYGVLIAYVLGILKRALEPFPEALQALNDKEE